MFPSWWFWFMVSDVVVIAVLALVERRPGSVVLVASCLSTVRLDNCSAGLKERIVSDSTNGAEALGSP